MSGGSSLSEGADFPIGRLEIRESVDPRRATRQALGDLPCRETESPGSVGQTPVLFDVVLCDLTLRVLQIAALSSGMSLPKSFRAKPFVLVFAGLGNVDPG